MNAPGMPYFLGFVRRLDIVTTTQSSCDEAFGPSLAHFRFVIEGYSPSIPKSPTASGDVYICSCHLAQVMGLIKRISLVVLFAVARGRGHMIHAG